MTHTIVNDIHVDYDPTLSLQEITSLVKEEAHRWKEENKTLGRMELTLSGDNITIKASEKSPIRRVRRITGYLSNIENFNDAKHDELDARYKHCKI